MALFKDFTDKKLTFLPGTQYRCLFIDDVKPRMLVFDKAVLRGDILSLVGVVAQTDKAAAQALVAKKSKLKSGSVVSDGKVHELTFLQPVKPEEVKAKLQRLNPTLGAKVKVAVAQQEDRQRPDDMDNLLMDVLVAEPEEVIGEEKPSAVDALDQVEEALERWRFAHGDPPVPPKDEETARKWQQDLGKIADRAKRIQVTHKDAFTVEEASRAREVEDDALVLQSRVGLLQRKGSFNKVDVKPILAWSWCSAHVERGKLLDVLKAALVPYESAVKAFHKAPSAKTLEAAEKAQGRLVQALEKVKEHYTQKNASDVTKLNITTLLLSAAKEQQTVLAQLASTLGDLDPEACAKRGARVLKDLLPTETSIDEEESQRLKDFEVQAGVDMQKEIDALPETIQREYDEQIERINGWEGIPESAKEGQRKKEAAKRDRRLNDPSSEIDMITRGRHDRVEIEKARSAKRAKVARLTVEALRPLLTAGEAVLKAVEAILPVYLRARAALGEAATPASHKAAWKALQALEKAVDKADTATLKRITALEKQRGSPPALPGLREDRTIAALIGAEISKEKSRLEAVEMELPQGRLAKGLADSEAGQRTLDAWVEELGGKAASDDDKALVRTAMRARFKITRLDGEMTTKALPKMYKYLTMVPEGHVRDNPKIARVLRNRKAVPDGFYAIEDDGTDGLISMDMPRTGNSGAMKALFGVILPHVEHPPGGWKGSGVKKSEAKIIFSHLTLHEVGHSMDEKLSFMKSRLDNPKYGGWHKEDAESVRKVAGEKLDFYSALDGVEIKDGETVAEQKHLANDPAKRKEFLDEYLVYLQRRQDPVEKLSKRAEKFTVDFAALEKHKGAQFIVASRLKPGAMQQVQQWDRKAETAQVQGRVYQEAYDKEYWSYDASVRSRGIGGYQFRAPGEWFSEIYACYYGGRLKSDHPDYAWLHALVANK